MDYREILGFAAIAITFISYVPYIKDILTNRTKPHAFSWLIWTVLTAIAFIGQLKGNAGPGAWATGFTALICFGISLIGLIKNHINILFVDWLSLFGANIALFFWLISKDPLICIILITLTNAIGYIPTIRKAYTHPFEETLSTYILSGLKFIVALYALTSFTFLTVIFPLSIIFICWSFAGMLIVRRAHMNHKKIFSKNRFALRKSRYT